MLHALQDWLRKGTRDLRTMNLKPTDRTALSEYIGTQLRARVEINGSFAVGRLSLTLERSLLQFTRLLNNSQRGLSLVGHVEIGKSTETAITGI